MNMEIVIKEQCINTVFCGDIFNALHFSESVTTSDGYHGDMCSLFAIFCLSKEC